MTDTGQVPGEGLPENAGMVDQPGVPAPGAYTYLSETTAEDEDLLLLPGAQSAWGNEVAPPTPEPVVEALHEPGAHEMSGRDSGAVDLSAVRMPGPAPVPPTTPRRPLHLGPPTPDASASPVRSLADRGAVGAAPVRQPGPPTAGPEYLDIAGPQPAAPWGAPAPSPAPAPVSAEVPAAETVVPSAAPAPEPADAAQAAMARLAAEAVAVAQPVEGPEPGHAAQEPKANETVPAAAPEEAGPFPVAPVADEVSVPVAQFPVPEGDSGAGSEAGQVVEPVAEAVPVAVAGVAQDTEPAAPTDVQAAEDVQAPEAVVPEAVAPEPEPVAVPEPPVAEPVAPEAPVVVEAAVPDAAQAAEGPEAVVPESAEGPVVAEPEPVVPVAEEPPAPEPPQVVEPVPAPEVPVPDLAAEAPALDLAAEAPAPDLAAEAPAPEPAPETPTAPTPFVAAPTELPAEPAAPVVAEAPVVIPEPAPQPEPFEAQPVTPAVEEPEAPAPQPYVADPAGPQLQTPEAGVPRELHPEQPLGQFVPVAGQVPTTPHLAPTPPQPIVLPAEESPSVPAPRAGGPEPVQHAEDLDTRAADQEESTAPVAEARQATGPAAPAYEDAEREAVLKVMRERRDIRNGFRSDPIPHEVLLRVLEAAHTAPSVGHSQPWDFVVIRSAETRRTMHELAMRQRDAYAKSLPKGRAKQFKELKIEAILDTPVNIVVTADPTRGGRHTLGRHTQPQMAPYSSALAVENLWLAARAEGLGVGWVSFFDEREMVRTLGLPDHLEVVAYLCVGYVDEFPDEPELMQAGWSKRRPLSWVVHEETYGRRALPGEDPHDLLGETVAQIRPLDAKALGEAWERQKRMTKPAGALGMLEIISAQLSGLSRQCPPPIPEPAAVAIFAGDHGVHAQGVTPWPQEVTAQMVANFLGGGAVCNAFAGQVGAEVCVVDVGVAADLPATPGLLPRKVRAGTSDMTTGPAMTREEAKQAIEVGIETARDLVAAGNKALLTGEMGIANTTASAALISVFTGADPAEVTGRGTGINDETLARKTEVVRRALEVHQPDPADPIGVLAAIGGFEHAAMVGLLLGGASLRTPVILDGVSAGAAALVARAIAPEVLAACIAGHRSAEPGHVAALNKLGLRPLVDLDLRLGEGTGALLALPLVQSTARAMHEVATFDSAGVTEK
ncbi:nicotinate-nucleotide--dimethylbenzimidazole phosphoribosyltransferase [Streptomyces sp. P17]|uniref:nicotinate-nucleotide--dimethylbenzimidazole phosphoribosyltransferase n=1 Tax=Streptomyces sp. P17 TaxID=3074716 RepID=UPI0028F432B5|nr:nicotinate-nucleotide--dimethylbenzimidazole phosphoribosyltransferase [Streptomyces sp. P17]MDT9697705.1 nicotinate-nucleotide--dimethylbenzimidazole phosphoribosyltransferase [Streptomyces sp. P17]